MTKGCYHYGVMTKWFQYISALQAQYCHYADKYSSILTYNAVAYKLSRHQMVAPPAIASISEVYMGT